MPNQTVFGSILSAAKRHEVDRAQIAQKIWMLDLIPFSCPLGTASSIRIISSANAAP